MEEEFRHPAEQGSTAEDFIGPKQPYPFYQYSRFLNGGRDEQVVVRASTLRQMLEGKRNLELCVDLDTTQQKPIHSNGTGNRVGHFNGNGNGHANGQIECDHHEAQIFTVKKEGPNKGRQFKSCTKCRKFLGFV